MQASSLRVHPTHRSFQIISYPRYLHVEDIVECILLITVRFKNEICYNNTSIGYVRLLHEEILYDAFENKNTDLHYEISVYAE